MSKMNVSNLTRDMLENMFKEGKRFDGRTLLDLKDFEIETGISYKAEGSARVKHGKTEVAVGVKLEAGEPYGDSPDKGNLMISADLLPLASPRYEMGPPGFDAIELPRLIDRMVRESGMIDFKKLCIKEGELVWTVIVDIYPINDDGAIIDAASIGTLVALRDAVFPSIDEKGKIDYENKTKDKLPINKDINPLTFTFYKLGNSTLLSPTREEEEACDSKIMLGISKYGGKHMINSCQKGLETPLDISEMDEMMKILPKKYDEVMKKLIKVLN